MMRMTVSDLFFTQNVLFPVVAGKREFEWALEVAQYLIDERVMSKDHVLFQALSVTVGTFGGAWEMHHIPWPEHAAWFFLCKSLRNQGTLRACQLLSGKPKSIQATPVDHNFVIPSRSSLERNSRMLDYSEGPKPELMEVFVSAMENMAGQNAWRSGELMLSL